MTDLQAIDPPGCACTDCITGYSVPLGMATAAQIADLLSGRLTDRTGMEVETTVTVTASCGRFEWRLP